MHTHDFVDADATVVTERSSNLLGCDPAALLGHVDGVELVSAARRADMVAITFEGTDEVMSVRTSWAFGFSPHRPRGRPYRCRSFLLTRLTFAALR